MKLLHEEQTKIIKCGTSVKTHLHFPLHFHGATDYIRINLLHYS